ncbi:hypothetical protein EVAR_81658_1 [Eumeta japonica]|uniref:HAT C-terminal dimerisation domain-containing protein n=1 Tax=Eumeta variegata TaxID=151549 RepID=A0A4C1V2V7_EUMVA|nr:hypothetical protein EVAR_81658_1 [Eumeta japonica]
MQLIDLKSKDLWSRKFTELKSKLEELEVQKCMYLTQQKWTALKKMPQVEALIFDAWNSLPDCYSEVKKLAFGVLTIFGSTYSCKQAFSCMNIIKSKIVTVAHRHRNLREVTNASDFLCRNLMPDGGEGELGGLENRGVEWRVGHRYSYSQNEMKQLKLFLQSVFRESTSEGLYDFVQANVGARVPCGCLINTALYIFIFIYEHCCSLPPLLRSS